MITTGSEPYRPDGDGTWSLPDIPHEAPRKTEVIYIGTENKVCDDLEQYPIGVHGATGGVINGKPVVCGGTYGSPGWYYPYGMYAMTLPGMNSWSFHRS